MKNLIKLFLLLVFLTGFVNKTEANGLDKLIKSSPLDESSVISVSVKDTETGKTIYKYNDKKLLHPASTLKVFTTFPSLDALGSDYAFETGFYTYNDNLYIKLAADPFLSSLDLKQIAKGMKSLGHKTFKNIYFDDSIIDNVEWGVGWMWDDNTNSYMPKFSAYNLDNNTANITVVNSNGSPIVQTPFNFPFTVLNAVKIGNSNNVYAVRHDWVSPDIVCVNGTLASAATVTVPINNMRRYFENRLFYYLDRSKIQVQNRTCMNAAVPKGAKKITYVSHAAGSTIGSILKASDNRCAETLAKVAGGVKAGSTGTIANQIQVFYDYWKEKDVDTSGIIIADASGVSRNNLITTDFMTNALNKLYDEQGADTMKGSLAQPGEGTMANRLLNYRGSFYLKTGTLSNISAITGYVVADNGKTYSVAIMIQNFVYPMLDVKIFENKMLEAILKL